MTKQDFKLIHEIGGVIPKAMDLSRDTFEAVICSTIDSYAIAHDLEREVTFLGVMARFMALDGVEGDNDKE